MPSRWQEWEKGKKEVKTDPMARKGAVNDALKILQQAQRASRSDPDARVCPQCGGKKFKTVRKGQEWVCRSCGKSLTSGAESSGPIPPGAESRPS